MPTGYSNKTGQNPFKGKKRTPFSKEHKEKMSKSHMGLTPWNKDKTGTFVHSEETKEKMSQDRTDDKHPMWKGDKVGYDALHGWAKRKLVKPLTCEHCGKEKLLDLANKDHKYKRNLNDWLWLCKKCHRKYDHDVLGILFGKETWKRKK